MNFFEQELRKIVEHCERIRNPKFVGRACVGRLDDGIVVKVEFFNKFIHNQYDAMRSTLMNRSDGKVDSQLIRFNELWGSKRMTGNEVKPHLWKYNDEVEWYCYTPTKTELKALSESVDDYLECFAEPNFEETEEMEMSM